MSGATREFCENGYMPQRTDHELVRQSIAKVVDGQYARPLVAAYFDPSHGFAGALFDGLDSDGLLAHNPTDSFSVDDIAAASLLDVRYGPRAVRALLSSDVIQSALTAVPDDLPLWQATQEDLDATHELWILIRGIKGVGRTRASKLLARKRPQLVPIVDSVIADALQLHDQTWRPMAAALADQHLRKRIDGLRPADMSKRISTLRLLDVLTWMSHSRSRAAVSIQIAVGAPPTRKL